MCELFALNSEHSIGARYSLLEFARHGGLTHDNSSGWGISFQRQQDTILIKEPEPAFDSPWVEFVSSQHVLSHCMIAHIRRASRGEPSHANTHPFLRELGGRSHLFAHNGTLVDFRTRLPLTTRRFRPLGQTDSEHAFCHLLERLAPLWDHGHPSIEERMAAIVDFAGRIRALGTANFFYFDSETLFVHSDQRRYDEDGPGAAPRPYGLYSIDRCRLHIPGLRLAPSSSREPATVLFASVPLSDDPWAPLARGTVAAVSAGKIVAMAQSSG